MVENFNGGKCVNAACSSLLRALPVLVMCCIYAKPYTIKSFHVGSMFHLDVVLSSGFAWAWLGGSSSSQILREAAFVLKALQSLPPEETPSVESDLSSIPSRRDPEKAVTFCPTLCQHLYDPPPPPVSNVNI